MDPLTLSLAGAGVSGVMSLIGYLASQGQRDEANQLLEQAYQQYGDVVFEQLPNVAPQLLGPSQMASVETDPRFRDAQLKALTGFEDIQKAGGLMAEDKAVLNQMNREAEHAESGRQARILENMRARGVGGSGAELAAQLSSAQGAAERGQQRGLDVAGQAQRRSLDALMGGGQLAGSIRGQEFGEQSARAKAADEIARYNSDAGNRFAMYNADQAARRNQQAAMEADRRLAASQGRAGIRQGQAQATQGLYSGIGSALNAGAGSASQYANSQNQFEEWLKKQNGGY